MFNKLNLQLIRIYVNIVNTVISTPYSWDIRKNTVKVADSISRRIGFYFAYAHTFGYLCFLLLRLVYLTQGSEVNFVSAAWIGIWINLYLWGLISFHNGHTTKFEVIALFRGLQKLTREFQQANNGASFRELLFKFGILDLHYLATIWIVFIYEIAVSLMFLVVPNRVQYIYSFFFKTKQRSSWQFMTFLVFEVYSKASIVGMMAADGLLIFSVLVSTTFWLKHFNGSTKMPTALKIENYRRLQILNTYFNHSFTWLLIPFLFCWIPASLAITCCFSAIRFHSFLPFLEYFPFPIIFNNMLVVITVTMVPAAAVFKSSKKMHQDLINNGGFSCKKAFRKDLVSLRSFGVKLGPIKVIKQVGILFTYYLISNNVFTLLITFPEEAIKH